MEDIQVEKILRMNGEGDSNSYANNSSLQKMVISKAKNLIQESTSELYGKFLPECFEFADFGCASGPSAYMPAWEIIEVLDSTCERLNRKPPMLQIFLNDLPGNDFNSTFKLLPSFYKRIEKEKGDKFGQCFVAAVPGSFYGRLFRPNSLHLIFSSYSLHWLSQIPKGLVSEDGIPLNKENIYPAKTSPSSVHKAYLYQFGSDFTTFLRFRYEELKPGGRMILTLMGNPKCDLLIWEKLGMVINDMVHEGLIEESKLESFNFPFYAPSAEEVREAIEREGSYNIHKLETFQINWSACIGSRGLELDKYARAKHFVNVPRAASESLLANHFGKEMMDDIYHRLSIKIVENMDTGTSSGKSSGPNLLISLIKK